MRKRARTYRIAPPNELTQLSLFHRPCADCGNSHHINEMQKCLHCDELLCGVCFIIEEHCKKEVPNGSL